MPHKEGHWGYKTRKKIQDKVGKVTNKIKNKSKLLIDKGQKTVENINPNSKINKKINKKKSDIKEKGYLKSGKERAQLSALKRKKKDIKLPELRAAQDKKMRDAAEKRHKQFKKTGKSTVEQRRAAAKKAMQDRAKAKHKAWKESRKKK